MKEKILLGVIAFIFGMFLISLASAELSYPQNTLINLQVPCTNNGSACSAAAFCNLTLTGPNSTTIVNNQAMTNLGTGMFNYSINPVTIVGPYNANVFCSDGGVGGHSNFPISITQSGYSFADEFSKLVWLYSLAIILYFAFLFMAWKTEYTWLGVIAGIILLVPGINLMINSFGLADYLLTRGIALVLIGISLITLIGFAFESMVGGDEEGPTGKNKDEDYDYYKEE